MSDQNKRMRILEMIETGEVSAEEGLRMLGELNGTEDSGVDIDQTGEEESSELPMSSEEPLPEPSLEEPNLDGTEVLDNEEDAGYPSSFSPEVSVGVDMGETDSVSFSAEEPVQDESAPNAEPGVYTKSPSTGLPEGADKWRRWWMIPLWIGVGITVLGGLFMAWAFQASGLGFWFICWSVFFAFGLLILVLAAQSRTARWLHLRVKQKPGESPGTIALSFPLPLGLARWVMRVFGQWIPKTNGASPDDILTALDAVDETVSYENPIYIEVDDEDGERVEIYIG